MRTSTKNRAAASIAACTLALPIVALVPGCGFSGSRRLAAVPDVAGEPLDAAEDELDARGLRYRTVGGGAFGIVIRSRWNVCKQVPSPGVKARRVTLYVARACEQLVPDVVGLSLEQAEEQLDRADIGYSEESLNGETVVVESLWTVCDQSPVGGEPGSSVELYVSHDCDEEWWSS
jgi:beta-lactam-binding protein with PASTA domain